MQSIVNGPTLEECLIALQKLPWQWDQVQGVRIDGVWCVVVTGGPVQDGDSPFKFTKPITRCKPD
jgi:hypothetical protein